MGLPLQYSCPENFMNRGAWWATVHGVTKSRTQLSDLAYSTHFLGWEEGQLSFKSSQENERKHMYSIPLKQQVRGRNTTW